MLASSHFNLTCGPNDDWFDVILDADTKLFLDPFLVFKERDGRWADAHAKLIAHFNYAFHLIAESHGNQESLSYQKALHVLTFPEPKEFCLGYTSEGTSGLGSGPKFARVIAGAIEDAISRGIQNPKHFEETRPSLSHRDSRCRTDYGGDARDRSPSAGFQNGSVGRDQTAAHSTSGACSRPSRTRCRLAFSEYLQNLPPDRSTSFRGGLFLLEPAGHKEMLASCEGGDRLPLREEGYALALPPGRDSEVGEEPTFG